MADLPSFEDYLNANQMPPSPGPQGNQTPAPSGDGNWLTAGLGSGFHQALGQVGGAVQAGATLVGADQTAQSAADYAASQRAAAASYARPDLEGDRRWSIPGMGYQIAQGVPSLAAMLGVGAVSAIGAPEEAAAGAGFMATAGARRLLGAGLTAYPLSVGSNVEAQTDYDQNLTQGQAAKALGLGVPEAAAQAILPHQLEGALAKGMGGDIVNSILKGAASGAAIQGGVGALTEYLTQQMGDPNRQFADKAQGIVQAALGGAFQGGVVGGAIHALAKTPEIQVTNDDMATGVDQALGKVPTPIIETQPTPPVGPPTVPEPTVPMGTPEGQLPLLDRPAPTEAQLLKQYAGVGTTPDGQLDIGALPQALSRMVSRYPSAHLSQLVDQFNQVRNEGQLPPGDVMLHDAMIAELNARAGARLVHPEEPAGPDVPPPTVQNQPVPEEPVVLPKEAQPEPQPSATVQPAFAAPPETPPAPAFDVGAVRSEFKGLPKTLTDGVTSEDELKARLQAHIEAKDASDRQPLKPVRDLAEKLGVTVNGVIPDSTQELHRKLMASMASADRPSAPVEWDDPFQDVNGPNAVSATEAPPKLAWDNPYNTEFNSKVTAEPPKTPYSPETKAAAKAVLDAHANLTAALKNAPDFVTGFIDANNYRAEQLNRLNVPQRIVRDKFAGDNDSSSFPTWRDNTSQYPDIVKNMTARGAPPEVVDAASKYEAARKNLADTIAPEANQVKPAAEPVKANPRTDTIVKVRALIDKIAHDPDYMGLATKADELKSRIEIGTRDSLRGVAKETRDLQDVVEGKIAQQRIQPTLDLTKDAGYYTEPSNSNAPSKIAESAIQKIKATKKTPAPVEAPAPKVKPKNQTEAKAQKVEPAAPVSVRPSQPIRDSLTRAAGVLKQLREQGAVVKNDLTKESPEFTKYKDSATKAAEKAGKPVASDDELFTKFKRPIQRMQDAMQSEATAQQQKLAQLAAHTLAMDGGDPTKLQAIKDNFFGSKLFDDHWDNANPATQKLIEDYDQATQGDGGLMDTIRANTGPGPVPLLSEERGVTQHDRDLLAAIHNTNDQRNGRGLMEHLMVHGSTPSMRELARILREQGINPRVRLGGEGDSDYEFLKRNAKDAGRVVATYDDKFDTIGIHAADGAEQSLLHEMVHAATMKALRAGGPAAKEMQALVDHVKANSGGENHYGLSNVREFVAEAFTNPRFQKFLMGIGTPGTERPASVWKTFKNAVFRMLGGVPRTLNAFDSAMDVSHKLMNENRGLQTPVEQGDTALRTISNASDAIYARVADQMMAEVKGKALNFTDSARKQALGWMTNSHISQVWGKLVPALKDLVGIQHHDSVRADTLAKHSVAAYMQLKALPHEWQDFVKHMMARTVQSIDPSKTWDEHTWLHGNANSSVLMTEVMQANNEWRKLNSNPEARKAYDAAKASNEADRLRHQAHFARDLMHTQGMDGGYAGFETDPFADYERRRDLHDDPAKALAFWKDVTDNQKVGLKKFQGELSGARDLHNSIVEREDTRRAVERTQGTKVPEAEQKFRASVRQDAINERNRLKRNFDDVKSLMGDFDLADKRASEGTYFHLSREGSHFVAGHIAVDPAGEVNAANASDLLRRMRKAGFNDAMIMRGAENTSVYVRVRDAQEMEGLYKVFAQAQRDGVVAQDKPVSRGEADATNIYSAISPVWMKRLIEAVKTSQASLGEDADPAIAAALESTNKQQIRDLTRTMLGMTAENSLSRLYSHRENVQGFSKNMIESFGKSSIANARGTSRLSLAEEMAQSMRDMKDQVRANNENGTMSSNQILGGAQAASELIQREKNRETAPPSNFMDGVRQMTHTFQVGASPAYVFTQMTQIPTLSLAELAKTHGFANSALALGRAAPLAIKVLRAIMGGPDATRFGMRDETLLKAGISKADVDFLMTQAMRGDFHHSSYTQAMAGHGPLSHGEIGKYTAAATSMGLYAEMMPRILTAIAARDLYLKNPEKARGMSLEQFVSDKVSQSQMDWAPSGNARHTTRQGMFGSMSPLINQFMGFQIRLTEKMYREVADAFGQGRTAEERAGARKFLLGHAAAVAMFAGTLGLPMLSTAAAVYDKLKDWALNEDSNDVTASYRTFLAHTFGKEVGEVIARGLPRAFGADFDHVGEGRIVPGSSFVNFLAEKRSMEDAEKDWLKSEAGSATGFLANLGFAARDILDQDYMKGLTKMAPEILKSPFEAAQIAERGFVDKNGAKLPITPNAADIAMKVLGIDPAKEAEYDEVKRTATGLNTMRQLRDKNITQHLVLAANRGDTANEQYWMGQSQEYQQDHPGLLPPAAEFARNLMKSQRQSAIARATGMPLGENMRDIMSRGMVGFGNFRNQ